jgi:hypothetical protein
VLSSITLADKDGADVPLHAVAANSKRVVTGAHGILGVSTLRDSRRVRPTAHGGIDETRWEDGKLVVLEGEVISEVSQADAITEFRTLTAPMIQTLDNGPALLKWQEGPPDAREGLTNLALNPKAGDGTTANWTNTGLPLLEAVTLGAGPTPAASGSMPAEVDTGLHATSDASGDSLRTDAPVTSGQSYTFSIWAYLLSNSAGGIQLTVRNAGGTVKGSSAVFSTLGAWTLLTVTVVADATESWRFTVAQSGAGAAEWYVAGALIGPNVAYFDGDTEGGQWGGAPNASTSTFKGGKQRLVKLASDLDPALAEVGAYLPWQAQFYCPDPRTYAQAQSTWRSGPLAGAAGGLKFPFTFPFQFNPSALGGASGIVYGTRPTPPILRVYGYCSTPRVQLLSTGEEIVLTGEVGAGDYLELDCAARTVKLNGLTSRLNLLDFTGTSWWELPPGTQTVQLFATSFDANARVDVLSRAAYA